MTTIDSELERAFEKINLNKIITNRRIIEETLGIAQNISYYFDIVGDVPKKNTKKMLHFEILGSKGLGSLGLENERYIRVNVKNFKYNYTLPICRFSVPGDGSCFLHSVLQCIMCNYQTFCGIKQYPNEASDTELYIHRKSLTYLIREELAIIANYPEVDEEVDYGESFNQFRIGSERIFQTLKLNVRMMQDGPTLYTEDNIEFKGSRDYPIESTDIILDIGEISEKINKILISGKSINVEFGLTDKEEYPIPLAFNGMILSGNNTVKIKAMDNNEAMDVWEGLVGERITRRDLSKEICGSGSWILEKHIPFIAKAFKVNIIVCTITKDSLKIYAAYTADESYEYIIIVNVSGNKEEGPLVHYEPIGMFSPMVNERYGSFKTMFSRNSPIVKMFLDTT